MLNDLIAIVDRIEANNQNQQNILGKIDLGVGYVSKEEQPNDLVALEAVD